MSTAASIMRTAHPTWLLLASACISLAGNPLLRAAEGPMPHIAECRVGFEGFFKVGHWTPLAVQVAGNQASARLTIEVTTPDNDGTAVTSVAPIVAENTAAEPANPTLVYFRAGRLGGSVAVKLLAEDGRILDRREFSATDYAGNGAEFFPLTSTGQLVVQLGDRSIGLVDALRSDETDGTTPTRGAAQTADVARLPTEWFGYDGVDVLVLTTGDTDFCARLADDDLRMDALRKWVELGGRLVLAAGQNAAEWIAPGKPFADLVPGKFVDLVRLPQTQAIESFALSREPIGGGGVQQNLPVPRLVDVEGRVEAFGRGNELPLVVRCARGFGELTYVGVDLTEPPLADWSGRAALIRALLRPYVDDANDKTISQKLVSLGYDDLVGALRQQLGRSFDGVAAIGFPVVAALVISYVILLGPLNYLFVEKLVHRPLAAWLTMPLVVLAATVGTAGLLASAKATRSVQINTAEIVDVDLSTGHTRGTCWAVLYSSQARRFDVALSPHAPQDKSAARAQSLVSWFGLPGSGVGGMHSASEPIDVTGVGYREKIHLDGLEGLPVLTNATKSLGAQWDRQANAHAAPLIAAELRIGDDGHIVGAITNHTGARLDDACLLSSQSGYRLGDLQPGQRLEIGPELSPLLVKTIVARRVGHTSVAGKQVFRADQATAAELLNVMMFYRAVGGESFVGLPHRYQAHCDLSRLLEFDRAILIARGTGPASTWTDAKTQKPLAGHQNQSTILYRFVLPVAH